MENIFLKNIRTKLIIFCLLSILLMLTIPTLIILTIFIMPEIGPFLKGPGMIINILGIGIGIILLTAWIIYFGLKTSLSLPKKFFIFTFIYNALIVAVKFTMSILSVYQVNQVQSFSFNINKNPIILTIISAITFLLYFIVFSSIYLYFKRKVKKSIMQDANIIVEKTKKRKLLAFLGVIISIVIIFGAIGFKGVRELIFVPLLFVLMAREYLSFVFPTFLGLLIALALIGAIYFAAGAFSSVAEQAIIMRNIAILSSFFWAGTILLLIYHALWVVYLFILTIILPFRVVVPK